MRKNLQTKSKKEHNFLTKKLKLIDSQVHFYDQTSFQINLRSALSVR